jgi:hypothetical protein
MHTTMEPVWKGLLTTDYEQSRPDATLLYWEIATRSHIAWPQVLMDDPTPYGRLRRPGIVDIPEGVHTKIVAAFHTLLADPDQVAALAARTTADRATATTALNALQAALDNTDPEEAAPATAAATEAILRTSAVQIVNWLLPEPHYERLLTGLLGTLTQARACLLALQLPDQPGVILTAATRHHGEPVADGRTAAHRRRDRWLLALDVAAALADGKDGPLARELTAMGAVLGWAASCEERRHELRARYLTQVKSWCTLSGTDLAAISIDDLLGAAA